VFFFHLSSGILAMLLLVLPPIFNPSIIGSLYRHSEWWAWSFEYRAHICKRLRSPGIDSEESLPSAYVGLAGRYDNKGCRSGLPDAWESIPELLNRFTNTDSGFWQNGTRICKEDHNFLAAVVQALVPYQLVS